MSLNDMPSRERTDSAPDPDDPRKPDDVGDLESPSRKYVARKVLREFSDDQCTDLAAALTYYAVLALFPAILALLSLLGLVMNPADAVKAMTDVLDPLVSTQTMDTVKPVITSLASSKAAGFTLIIGLLGALWSASGYVGAFGRAMNRIYEIKEGRPFWKLRPLMLLITLIAIVLSALVLVMLVISGPLATSLGNAVGIGSTAVTIWNIAKWPVLAIFVMLIVALLYYATPNVKQPKFKWISVGAAVAIVIWVLASIGFGFYVANFGSYNKTYGALAGAIVALLWLWITNVALMLGAEIDSELERGRQLQAGIAAEEELQLPPRDTSGIDKAREKEEADIEKGREIRERAAHEQETESAETGSGSGATVRSER